MVMVDLPRQGQTDPNNVPFRGVQPAAFAIRDECRIVAGRRFERGVREVIVGKKAAQEFAGLTVGSTIDFRDSDWTVVGIFETGGDVHESEIWADAEATMSAFRRGATSRSPPGSPTGRTPDSQPSRTRSAVIRASRSACSASPSTTPGRPRCSQT